MQVSFEWGSFTASTTALDYFARYLKGMKYGYPALISSIVDTN